MDPMNVKHLDHLNMTVKDLDESLDWYRRVLGFERVEAGVWRGRRWAIARSGEALLCLYEHPDRLDPDPSTHDHHGLSHFGVRIADAAAFEAVLAREGVEVHYGGPTRWPHSTSWYIGDPSGWEIEVVCWDEDRVRFDA
jgi:catechol 2,3-dioxygenase-like lactoylglutathione lyase family enzyme